MLLLLTSALLVNKVGGVSFVDKSSPNIGPLATIAVDVHELEGFHYKSPEISYLPIWPYHTNTHEIAKEYCQETSGVNWESCAQSIEPFLLPLFSGLDHNENAVSVINNVLKTYTNEALMNRNAQLSIATALQRFASPRLIVL